MNDDDKVLEYLSENSFEVEFMDDGFYFFVPKRIIIEAIHKYIENKENK